MEFGSSTELDGTDPSFEIVSAYSLGAGDSRKKIIGFDEEEEEEELPLITEEEKLEDELVKADDTEELISQDKKEARRLEKEARLAAKQQKRDSISLTKEQEKLLKAEEQLLQKTRDSIVEAPKTIKPGRSRTDGRAKKRFTFGRQKAERY